MTTGRTVDGILRLLDGSGSVVSVDTGSCSRSQGSSCVACIDSCPVAALSLDGEGLAPAVDAAACIGCGICVPACPTGATSGVGIAPARIAAAALEAPDRLEVRCGAARSAAQLARPDAWAIDVFCLAAVDAETVAAVAARLEPGGVLTLVRSDCATCPARAGRRVEETSARGAALAARVAPDRTVAVEVVDSYDDANAGARHPAAARDRVRDAIAPSRRDLLSGFTRGRSRDAVAERPSASSEDVGSGTPRDAAAVLPPPRTALLAIAPRAPLSRPFAEPGCTACEACSTVCPTGALTWTVTLSDATLTVDERACLACGECVRVCPEDVLALGCSITDPGDDSTPSPATVTSVRMAQCEACGAELHPGEIGRCTRCASRRSLLDDVWSAYG